MASAIITGNVASIDFRDVSTPITVSVTTNNAIIQRVKATNKGQDVYQFEGKGERTLIGSVSMNGGSVFDWKFEFQVGDWKPSSLRLGGPYAIGATNFLIIVAENGDDTDYNDVVLQFSWKTK